MESLWEDGSYTGGELMLLRGVRDEHILQTNIEVVYYYYFDVTHRRHTTPSGN